MSETKLQHVSKVDADAPRLPLFDAFSGSQIGVFLGVWILAIAVVREGGYVPASRKESWIATLTGLPLILLLVPLFSLVEDTGVIEILAWSCLPVMMGLGLTRFVQKKITAR